MIKRALKGAAALLTVLALILSGAGAEGYMMVFGSLKVYGDRDLKVLLGEIGDASIVYTDGPEEGENGTVTAVVFGDNWILRTGYVSGGSLMPLLPDEAEAYAREAADGMLYTGGIRLLNVSFVPAREEDLVLGSLPADDRSPAAEEEAGDEPEEPEAFFTFDASAAPETTPVPEEIPEFEVSEEEPPRATPSPIPTVTPLVTAAPLTLPPTPTKPPSSCVEIVVPPTDVSGYSGEEVVLAVGATGALSYTWQYFDGRAWVDSTMEQASSPAMKLVVFEGGRERIYRCVITGTDRTKVYTEPVRIIVQR